MIAWLVGMDGDDGIIVSLLAYRDSFIPSNPARVQGSCFVSLLKFSCLGQNHIAMGTHFYLPGVWVPFLDSLLNFK